MHEREMKFIEDSTWFLAEEVEVTQPSPGEIS
jgi:hypothetical protein